MKDYYINSDTLMLKPISSNETIVVEKEQKFVIKKSAIEIVNDSCCYFGSDFKGRCKGSKTLLNMAYKLPIIIENFNDLIIFPTCSFRKEDCCWICLGNVENYKKSNKETIIEFKNNIFIKINVSYGSFENQLFRATLLLTKIKQRKKVI